MGKYKSGVSRDIPLSGLRVGVQSESGFSPAARANREAFVLKMRIAQARLKTQRSLNLLWNLSIRMIALVASFGLTLILGLVTALIFLIDLGHFIYLDNSKTMLVLKVMLVTFILYSYQAFLYS